MFSELPQLPAANTPTEAVETEPTAPTNPTSETTEAPAIDVEATEAEADRPHQSPEAPSEKPPYHALNWREFLRYAKAQGINTRGKTRAEIELELLSQSQK